MPDGDLISARDIPCCPELSKDPCCEKLQFTYRLENRTNDVPVEIGLVFELERCPGPLALGDIVYSTTLLPGEKVRLYSNSRHSRFTYDSESEVTYRHENSSDESFYMTSMDRFMSEVTVREDSSLDTSSESSTNSSADVSGAIQTLLGGASANVSGNFSAEGSVDFMRQVSTHAESSSERSVSATRAVNSVSIGEVQSRTHTEGESESAYEASTRMIENKNQCRAVNYFAYQLEKQQTIKFTLKTVFRRLIDEAGPTQVVARPPAPSSDVSVIPTGVLATNANRVDVEAQARTSAFADRAKLVDNSALQKFTQTAPVGGNPARGRMSDDSKPVASAARAKALAAVDQDLVKAGVLDEVGGKVSPALVAELSFERTTCLPTQGILVKGCIDDCSVCEPTLEKSIELDLERKDLENKLLARQIELLEKSQEYRCCPEGETEDDSED